MPHIFYEYLITFGWAITGAVSMALALGLAVSIFTWITPINEWDEIRKGNMAMAIVLASAIIAFALVIANVAV